MEKSNKRNNGIFSPAIFKQSAKSNRTLWLYTMLGNCFLTIIVILILSSLSINATRDSMSSLFSSMDLESSVKSSAALIYVGYDKGIEVYENEGEILVDGTVQVYDLGDDVGEGYDAITQSRVILGNQSAADTIIDYYVDNYDSSTYETDEEKHEDAKTQTSSDVESLVTIMSIFYTIDETMEAAIPYFTDAFLDLYHEDSTKTSEVLVQEALPIAADNYAVALMGEEIMGDAAYTFTEYFITRYITYDSPTESEVSQLSRDATQTAVAILLDYYGLDLEKGEEAVDLIIDTYLEDTENFETANKDSVKAEVITLLVTDFAYEFAYLESLPDFTVEYQTNEFGVPYYTDANGNDVEITSVADRDKLVAVADNMGRYSNILQKKYKEILTGSDYTDEEKAEASQSAEELTETASAAIKEFLLEYSQNRSTYYDEDAGEVIEDAVMARVCSYLSNSASDIICETFDLDSIDEMTYSNTGIDGNELVAMIEDYAYSAVAVYKNRYSGYIEDGVDEVTALLASFVYSGYSIVDFMPVFLFSTLTELATANTYGMVICLFFFGCAGLILPMLFVAVASNNLIAGQVDSGAMAFTLSTPTKRTKITFTNLVYLVLAVTVGFLFIYLASILSKVFGEYVMQSPDLQESLTYLDLTLSCLGGYAVTLAVMGICFMCSCIFNKSSLSLGVGGGLAIFFFIMSVLGLFGSEAFPTTLRIDAMNIFNYCTIIRLFDASAVITQDYVTYWWKLSILFVIAIATSVVGIKVFEKKNLPL